MTNWQEEQVAGKVRTMGAIAVGMGSVWGHVATLRLFRTDVEAVGPKSRTRSVLAWAGITKHPRINNRHLYSPSSGGWKSKISVPGWPGSGESSPAGLWLTTISMRGTWPFWGAYG